MATTAPYGTWNSPISHEAIAKLPTIEEVIVDKVASVVYHIERRPSESGRSVLVETATGKDIVGPNFDLRNRVYGYGGGSAIVHDGIAYFIQHENQNSVIYKVPVDGSAEPVALNGLPNRGEDRFASLEINPADPQWMIAVHEATFNADIWTEFSMINTNGGYSTLLLGRVDFDSTPKISSDGKHLAWKEWYHPDMPWLGGVTRAGDFHYEEAYNSWSIRTDGTVAGGTGTVSAGYPSWSSDNDRIVYMTDESGYTNPWKGNRFIRNPLLPTPLQEDFAEPQWSLGQSPYALLGDQTKLGLFKSVKDGKDALYILNVETPGSTPQFIATPFVSIDNIRGASSTEDVFFSAQKVDEPVTILKSSASSLTMGEVTTVKPPVLLTDVTPGFISVPQQMDVMASDGSQIHVIFYPPRNLNYSGSSISGEKPPCVVNVHGGPTSRETLALDWRKQYFTSRGWAWLDVNYRGSSGYGRAYIEKLHSNWGVVDVEDCIRAAKTLSGSMYGLIDPKRLVIRGEGAGGFTALSALTTDPTVFAAATSSHGPTDLTKLDATSTRLELHYREKLLGGTPADKPDVYKERSPINNVDKIKVPVLFLHGDADAPVPPEHSETLHSALKDRGIETGYRLYEGENHLGWRKEGTISDALLTEFNFYRDALKIGA